MSIETDADVNITLNAEDNASSTIDDSTKKINRSWIEMRNQQRAVSREFEINNRVLVQTGRTLNSLSAVVSRTVAIYNTFQLQQLRTQQASENVADAQRDVNEAFLEFGQGSREHLSALDRLNDELEQQKRLAEEASIFWTLFGLTIATTVGNFVTRSVPQLLRLRETFRSVFGTGTTRSPIAPPPPAGAGLLSRIGQVGRIAGGVGIGSALTIASLAGEQEASAPLIDQAGQEIEQESLPSGFEAIPPAIDKAITIINNIFSPSSQETVDEIAENTANSLPFGNK